MSLLRRALARIVPFLVALLVAATLVPPSAVSAADDLVVRTAARYDLLPDQGRVRVTIEAVATSLTLDPPDARVYYTGMTLVVQPGATDISARSGGTALRTSISEATENYTAVEVIFSRGVYYRESYAFQVSYELIDPGGAPERDLRVRPSFAAFAVWAFGTETATGNRVEVRIPPGYTVTLPIGEMSRTTTTDGATLLAAEEIGRPLDFLAYVTAERPGAYAETRLFIGVGDTVADVLLQGWEDDPEWTERMRFILEAGLQALSEAIGLPYPIEGQLIVTEHALSRLGDYAGFFDQRLATIEVRYDVDPFVGLHEAAHIWFNASLFEERWIGEAFASFYAEEAGRRAGIDAVGFDFTPDLEGHAFPLNIWGVPGTEELDAEDFAYAATNEIGRQIADLATMNSLQMVWTAAADRELPYQRVHAVEPERSDRHLAAGWQRLLDLLENRTDAVYDAIWLDWIVTDDQAPLLAERRTARAAYQRAVADADDWELPPSIRVQMSSWEFDAAAATIERAQAVLADRARIEDRASQLDLVPPATLQEAFEGSDTLATAEREAERQTETLAAIAAVVEATAREPDLLESIGLLGGDPGALLGDARDAYQAGDLDGANEAAQRASRLRADAADLGLQRLALAGGGALVPVALVAVLLVVRRRRAAHSPPSTTPDLGGR